MRCRGGSHEGDSYPGHPWTLIKLVLHKKGGTKDDLETYRRSDDGLYWDYVGEGSVPGPWMKDET